MFFMKLTHTERSFRGKDRLNTILDHKPQMILSFFLMAQFM